MVVNAEDTVSLDAVDNLVNAGVVDGEDDDSDVWEDAEDSVWENVEDNDWAHTKYYAWMLMKILSILVSLNKLSLCLPTLPSIPYIGNCIHKSTHTAKQ